MADGYFAHPTAVIDEPVTIGDGTRIWHFCHISRGAVLGSKCNLGQNVYVAGTVRIGRNVKIQNNVSLYDGLELEDDVFCGPSCVFTNVINPRSEINRKGEYRKTIVRRGATIGANATIVCDSIIGRYALIGAGAVISRQAVPDYALMLGVPAVRCGWVSRHGHRLANPDVHGMMTCPESALRYREIESGKLVCVDLDEEESLGGVRT